ncbi:MAG TPA: enoyl-CoA hydratase-related protein [Pyrinomonadaceae bacterium]|jgi:enoyl-CoA hydratase
MVVLELKGHLAVVRLERPEKMNALSRRMLAELGEAFARVELDGDVRACILTGTGELGVFCAGTDIAELSELDESGAQDAARRGQEVCERIEHCRVPVTAAVNGLAAGGGCELALSCHLRIASTLAQFSLPETKLGVIPAYGGSQRLPRIIGHGRALEMMLTGASMSAVEAQRAGLVNRVTTPEQLLAEAESLAGEIAGLAPLAIRACLESVTRGGKMPLPEGLALEARLFSQLFSTEDMREGTSAFLEKRAPVFKGR